MGIYENARKATKEKITKVFWEMYLEQPLNKITVKQLSEACQIQRRTFYYYFQDVYKVLEDIEEGLSHNLQKIEGLFNQTKGGLTSFSQILYDCFQDKKQKEYINILVLNRRDPFFAQEYLSKLKLYLQQICIADGKLVSNEKEKILIDITISSIIGILLNGICNSNLSMNEIDAFIVGVLQNGYYVTLTNKFNIDVLNNPFQNEFW